MQYLSIIIALCIAIATPVIVSPKLETTSVTLQEIVAYILYWPALIASILLLVFSASQHPFQRPVGMKALTFLLAAVLPVTLLSTTVVRKIKTQNYLAEEHHEELWSHYGETLLPRVRDYVQQHPSTVTYPFHDDRANIAGLGPFLRQSISQIPIIGDDIIDPWGNPVWIVTNHDNKNEIRFYGGYCRCGNPDPGTLIIALHTKKQYAPSYGRNEEWQTKGGGMPKS